MALEWQPFPMPARRRAQAWRYHPAYRRPAHLHDEPELNLVIRGTATFLVGRRRMAMSAGSLLWYPPGLDHYLEHASEDLELYVVGFQPELLAAFAREHGGQPHFCRPPGRVPAEGLGDLEATLALAPSSQDDGAVERRLLDLLKALAAMSAASPPTLGHRAAALLVDDDLLGRDELARRLASNRGDVSRRFSSAQGLSLTEYKNRLHTLRLLGLLETGHENLTRAALEAGFGSYSRCHQVIRGLLGFAPSALLDPDVRRSLAERFEPLTLA
jgi:AraC-like DNA-binding protein